MCSDIFYLYYDKPRPIQCVNRSVRCYDKSYCFKTVLYFSPLTFMNRLSVLSGNFAIIIIRLTRNILIIVCFITVNGYGDNNVYPC